MDDRRFVTSSKDSFNPTTISRPDSALLKYYVVISLLTGPMFPITLIPLLFKYETLRYRFDEDGVSMSWGVLFRREIYLTYRRIQDIHLTRNLVQRWMGLATVAIQTASGSSGPEMSIEGILEADPLRDYLYSKMRGARGESSLGSRAESPSADVANANDADEEALALLREIRDSLQRLASQRSASHE